MGIENHTEVTSMSKWNYGTIVHNQIKNLITKWIATGVLMRRTSVFEQFNLKKLWLIHIFISCTHSKNFRVDIDNGLKSDLNLSVISIKVLP